MNWKKLLAATCATFLISSTALSAGKEDSLSELKAEEIDYDMDTEILQATGKVEVKHSVQQQNAAADIPSEVNADTVDYDMKTGVVTATGNVLLKYGADRATGGRATYNTNTQEAYLTGDVIVNRGDLRITCDALSNDGRGHMQADGNVRGVQTVPPDARNPRGDTRTFTGDHVDYYPEEKKHVIVPGGGLFTNNDGKFTADQMEGWIDDEYYIGIGNVHIVNPPRELEAGGDRIDYYATENGKAVLTGNAWAVQQNNTMRGNRLTVYLTDDKNNPAPMTAPKNQALPHELLTNEPFKK